MIYNNEHVLNLNEYYYSKHYISNNYKSQIVYVEHNLHKRYYNITFNKTNNMSKTIHKYTAGVVNIYKINQVSNLTKYVL